MLILFFNHFDNFKFIISDCHVDEIIYKYFQNNITFGSLYSLSYHESELENAEDDFFDYMMNNLIGEFIVKKTSNAASSIQKALLFTKNVFKKLRKIIDINSFQVIIFNYI